MPSRLGLVLSAPTQWSWMTVFVSMRKVRGIKIEFTAGRRSISPGVSGNQSKLAFVLNTPHSQIFSRIFFKEYSRIFSALGIEFGVKGLSFQALAAFREMKASKCASSSKIQSVRINRHCTIIRNFVIL